MGRTFVTIAQSTLGNHEGFVGQGGRPDLVSDRRELILTRDLIVTELRSRNQDVFTPPEGLDTSQVIQWINASACPGDLALQIQFGMAITTTHQGGASAFYITYNDERKSQADLILLALLKRLPQLANRGVRPDISTDVNSHPFCRQVCIPAIVLEIGNLTNPEDRFLIQNRRRDLALGIVEGVLAWQRSLQPSSGTVDDAQRLKAVRISVNGQFYSEQGVLYSGNAYVPVDLVDQFGLQTSDLTTVRRISYCGVVYLRGVDLRSHNLAVSWNSADQILQIRSVLRVRLEEIGKIMGQGYASEVQLMMFIKANNEAAFTQFQDLPRLYREEGAIEGVNYDVAFCQMCVETNFLRFGFHLQPNQNNFANLGIIGGSAEIATFPSARVGIRAQIQHLKAYACREPLVQEVVDPRFSFVARGVAPTIHELGGRWTADLSYGDRILALLRRLYESAGLL